MRRRELSLLLFTYPFIIAYVIVHVDCHAKLGSAWPTETYQLLAVTTPKSYSLQGPEAYCKSHLSPPIMLVVVISSFTSELQLSEMVRDLRRSGLAW